MRAAHREFIDERIREVGASGVRVLRWWSADPPGLGLDPARTRSGVLVNLVGLADSPSCVPRPWMNAASLGGLANRPSDYC